MCFRCTFHIFFYYGMMLALCTRVVGIVVATATNKRTLGKNYYYENIYHQKNTEGDRKNF